MNELKFQIRHTYKEIRQQIPLQRRKEAEQSLFTHITHKIAQSASILSFVSIKGEIDLSRVNEHLARENRLYLPRVVGSELHLFHCQNLNHLTLSSLGVFEPDPCKYEQKCLQDIDIILAPGMAFDKNKRRLGFGGGFYDRLISEARKEKPSILVIAVGFKEQLYSDLLPHEPHDEKVDELWLF